MFKLRIYVQRLKNALNNANKTPRKRWDCGRSYANNIAIYIYRRGKCVRYQCFSRSPNTVHFQYTNGQTKRVWIMTQSIIWPIGRFFSCFLFEKDFTKWTWSIYDSRRFIIANNFSGIFSQCKIYWAPWKRFRDLTVITSGFYCYRLNTPQTLIQLRDN